MCSDDAWSDLLPGVAGATVGAMLAAAAGVLFIIWQRRNDQAAQRVQQAHDDKAARDAEVAEGVVALWGGAARLMNTAWSLCQRPIRTYRFGSMMTPLVMEGGRAMGDLIAAYTRVFLSADNDLIQTADHVLERGQRLNDALAKGPWWRPFAERQRKLAVDKAFDDMAKALRDFRDLARTKLDRELPDLPVDERRTI